jgi:DNA segregation ATPase FtsK/SpoIIIE-like protein
MPSPLSVARPAVAAVALLAAVVVTGYALYAFWPAGVALGLAFGIAAVLAIGARMQVSERTHPADEDLAAQLGIELFEAPTERQHIATPRAAAVPAEEASARKTPARTAETVTKATRIAARVAPAPEAVATPEVEAEPEDVLAPAPVLRAQPDILYFTSDDDPDEAEARVVTADLVRSDLEHLKEELGDDYRDFARAARLVVSTQYASAARLQRDLDLPYSRARRRLADLEQQHFVGPATGSLPRQVLMPKDRLPEVERLLTEA